MNEAEAVARQLQATLQAIHHQAALIVMRAAIAKAQTQAKGPSA